MGASCHKISEKHECIVFVSVQKQMVVACAVRYCGPAEPWRRIQNGPGLKRSGESEPDDAIVAGYTP